MPVVVCVHWAGNRLYKKFTGWDRSQKSALAASVDIDLDDFVDHMDLYDIDLAEYDWTANDELRQVHWKIALAAASRVDVKGHFEFIPAVGRDELPERVRQRDGSGAGHIIAIMVHS
jgi:hypothetical protein